MNRIAHLGASYDTFKQPVDRSLWKTTANPPLILPLLRGRERVDVAIVGGGYLGLSCALRLAEAGSQVALLDAHTPGFGGSGRNGGQVIPGLKHDPDELMAIYGPEIGESVISLVGNAADQVFHLIERHGINCAPLRKGWIQGAHNRSTLLAVEQRFRQWAARGAKADMLDEAAIQRMVGTVPGLYMGGWIDHRAGSIHPLNYALGLAEAALSAGARIYRDSPATGIERAGSGWTVTTRDGGQLLADQVVVATNAYTDSLWPGLRNSIVPAQSSQVATDPLPSSLRETILPDGQVVSDARRLLYYYRLDSEGRLLMGGRGPLSTPHGDEDYAHIRRAVLRTFPQLAGVKMPYQWSGLLAMTRDGLPHVHEPRPGITIALGCNGRGVALTTATGLAIADHLVSGTARLPFAITPIRSIPLHKLHKLYITMMVQYYKVRDYF